MLFNQNYHCRGRTLQGKVKWFSQSQGYGFIVGEDGTDHFFGVRSIQGIDLPNNKDDVIFDPCDGKKGPAAKNVKIVKRHVKDDNSAKLTCPCCKKNVFPKLVTYQGEPDKSFCPACGCMLKDFVGPGNRLVRGLLSLF